MRLVKGSNFHVFSSLGIKFASLISIQSILDYPLPSEPDKYWRIIERDSESWAIEWRKSVPMVLVANSEGGGYSKWRIIETRLHFLSVHFLQHLAYIFLSVDLSSTKDEDCFVHIKLIGAFFAIFSLSVPPLIDITVLVVIRLLPVSSAIFNPTWVNDKWSHEPPLLWQYFRYHLAGNNALNFKYFDEGARCNQRNTIATLMLGT